MKPNQPNSQVDRRDFLKSTAASGVLLGAGALANAGALTGENLATVTSKKSAESYVKTLYESLNETQRSKICFEWDHEKKGRGLLRTHVSNNWSITTEEINSKFFNDDQR